MIMCITIARLRTRWATRWRVGSSMAKNKPREYNSAIITRRETL